VDHRQGTVAQQIAQVACDDFDASSGRLRCGLSVSLDPRSSPACRHLLQQ
jgi:hypothetical protein